MPLVEWENMSDLPTLKSENGPSSTTTRWYAKLSIIWFVFVFFRDIQWLIAFNQKGWIVLYKENFSKVQLFHNNSCSNENIIKQNKCFERLFCVLCQFNFRRAGGDPATASSDVRPSDAPITDVGKWMVFLGTSMQTEWDILLNQEFGFWLLNW